MYILYSRLRSITMAYDLPAQQGPDESEQGIGPAVHNEIGAGSGVDHKAVLTSLSKATESPSTLNYLKQTGFGPGGQDEAGDSTLKSGRWTPATTRSSTWKSKCRRIRTSICTRKLETLRSTRLKATKTSSWALATSASPAARKPTASCAPAPASETSTAKATEKAADFLARR